MLWFSDFVTTNWGGMPGLRTTAGATRAEFDIDRDGEIGSASALGRVVDFPGRDHPGTPAVPDGSALRQLTDLLLLPASMLHPQERAFAVDLVHAGLDRADSDTRREVSGRLARAGRVAPSIASRLVRDRELPVAQPLLRHGNAVADQDLIDIIRAGCPERTYQIAGRARVSPEVAAAVVAADFEPAIYALLRNAGAELTAGTVVRIAERAKTDPSLCEPLLNRPEMTAACALDMFWSVSRPLRLLILRRFLAESGMVRRILSRTPAALTAGEIAHSADEAGQVEALQSSITIALESHLRGDPENAVADLATLTGVSAATAGRILADPGGEALTVAVKAAGASRSTFAAALGLWQHRQSAGPAAPEAPDELLDLFVRLSRGHAAMAMNYWDWREADCGPYAAFGDDPSCGGPGK